MINVIGNLDLKSPQPMQIILSAEDLKAFSKVSSALKLTFVCIVDMINLNNSVSFVNIKK